MGGHFSRMLALLLYAFKGTDGFQNPIICNFLDKLRIFDSMNFDQIVCAVNYMYMYIHTLYVYILSPSTLDKSMGLKGPHTCSFFFKCMST